MGFLLWEEGIRKAGFKGGRGVKLSFSGFQEIAACVNSGVTFKGLRGVDTAVVAVEESCVLAVKSGTQPIISSGRVLDRFEKARHPCSPVFLA